MNSIEEIRQKILECKEKRWLKQKEYVSTYKQPILCIKFNIPSWPKMSPTILHAFLRSFIDFTKILTDAELDFKIVEINHSPVGPEAFLISKVDALALKNLSIKFEEHHYLGRFFDVDVLDFSGKIIEREVKRKCFLWQYC